MFETVQQLLRSRMRDDTLAVAHGDQTWTWREHLAEAASEASALIGLADTGRPLHVGALLGNSPAMLRSMAAAGLGGYVLCGINITRRGAGLFAPSTAVMFGAVLAARQATGEGGGQAGDSAAGEVRHQHALSRGSQRRQRQDV